MQRGITATPHVYCCMMATCWCIIQPRNILKWVPMRTMSVHPSLQCSSGQPMTWTIFVLTPPKGEPPRVQSLRLVHSRPAGDETDSNSWRLPSLLDSEEWDEPECGDWLCFLTPPFEEEGLTWEEITSEPPQRHIVMEWDDSVGMLMMAPRHQQSLTPGAQANRVHPEKKHWW